MGAKDGRAPYTRPSDDDQSLEDSLSEEADYYPDVKENALGSIDYNPVPGHSREVSGGQNGEGIGSLVRLVEALEMYDNGAMESYMTEDSMESAALMKGNHKQKPSQDLLASYVSDAYPIVERKGPITQKALDRFAEADMEDEYCALPFNNDPEYLNANVMPGSKPDYEGKIDASSSGGSVDGSPEPVADGDVKKPFWRKNPLAPLKGLKATINTPSLSNLKVPKLPNMTLNLNRKGGGVPKSNDLDDPRPDTEAPIPYAEWPLRPYQRKLKINLLGMLCFLLNFGCLGFYLWVRITKTLDLGSYYWYGILVLVIEMLGATTTLLYGLNILFDPVHEELPQDPENPGLTLVRMPYHVRVLIPCYKESVSIVSRTCKAASDAYLPAGCRRTIYLCDDGKDPQKCKMVEYLGDDFVYVSGRKRAVGEMNGKSSNLNNCLSQIYPPGIPIPPNELVCIFDADQVANADFFLKTLPLFDAGDDVGMVLSPQCFYNVDVNADIFNHSNVQFWEYAQHGYDAMGFNSCTGTNFLTRSSAFEEVGWSPTYTLTEDYALGMELTMNRWKCRYVEEYLAIGEAPEQLRNCFQQRSRWCKGHFQIVLSNDHCPLFQSRLTWFQRIMYCSGVWSYIVGAIATPFFIAVPLITIWAGIFPIVVSEWAAIALTAYFVAQYLTLNYVRKLSHLGPLWFANVANNILWFTFVKACWRAVGAACGKTITFKTTIKGANALMNSAIGDLWMPVLVLGGGLASFGFGLHKVIQDGNVITTLSISLVWIFYSMIPPYLLLHYHFIGKGHTLRYASRICYLLSFLCAAAAIVLLWLVYPRNYNYSEVLDKTFQFYDAERVGELPPDFRIPWRGDSLVYEIGPQSLGFGNVTGGWMGGGNSGTVKNTIPTAMSVAMIAWGLLEFPIGYEKSNQTAYAQDTLRWGCDYLLKLFQPIEGSAADKPEYAIIYQVGNLTADRAVWERPEEMTMRRPTYFISTLNGTSDLVGQMVAAFVSSAIVFQPTDPDYYDTLMTAAVNLYGAGTRHQGLYSANFVYACAPPDPTVVLPDPVTPSCLSPDEAFNGSMVYWYNSTSYRDDLTWAAAWLYKATGDPGYLSDAYYYWTGHTDQEGIYDLYYLVNWDNLIYPASVLLAELTADQAFDNKVQTFLQKWVCSSGATVAYTTHGRAYNFYDPSNAQTMNAALVAIIYGQLITPPTDVQPFTTPPYNNAYLSQRYICWTRSQSRYVLGDDGTSYVVGFGSHYPTQVNDRGAACPSAPTNCTAVNSLYNPEPNPHVINGALVFNPVLSDNFQNSRTSNDTWVSIEYQAGLAGTAAALVQVPGTYEECLQGYGIFSTEGAICDNNNQGS